MTTYNEPHEVRDQAKLQRMIDTIRNGGQLPPIVVCGYRAFTGSHRIAAWNACGIEHHAIEISDADYVATVTAMGLDWENDDVSDYNDFCDKLYRVTTDPDVKNAVKDQRK